MTSSVKTKPTAMLQDIRLIQATVDGNKAAREQLAKAILPRTRRIVYRSCSAKQDVDDVVQVAMFTVFRYLPTLRKFNRFASWHDTIVYNVIRNEGRKRVRLKSTFEFEGSNEYHVTSVTPEDEHVGAEMFKRLQYHIDQLKPNKRYAAVMSIFEGYVESEIAAFMGCNINSAKKRIQHGRKELLGRIQRDDAFNHPRQ